MIGANFFDLFTASVVQADFEFLSAVNDILLDAFELEAKERALKYLKRYGKTPSPKYAAKDDMMSTCMMKSSPFTREPLESVYDDTMEKLKGRYIERKHAEMVDEFRDTGVFPMAKQAEVVRLMSQVGVKKTVSYFELDRDDMYALKDLEECVDFGFEYVDLALGGIMNGEVCLLAARTGVGKSVIACYSAIRWARQGKRVLVVSLEMLPKQLAHRMDGMLGHFNPKVFRTRGTSPAAMALHRQSVQAEMDEIRADGGDIIFPDTTTISPQDLISQVRKVKPNVLVVDGVYLITPEGKFSASWEATKAASNALKQMSMEMQIPIFATSQFKRAGKEEGFSLEDLAYSDALGQDADSVLSMSREDGSLMLEVIKNRNGEMHGGSKLKLDWSSMSLLEEPFVKSTIKLGGAK